MSLPTETETAATSPLTAQAVTWRAEGYGVALATVVRTWGSSPCPVGSHLIIRDDGAFEGSVSGGCIEGEVVTEALACIRGGTCKTLDFGIANEDAWRVGLACGGKVSVFVSNINDAASAVLNALEGAKASGQQAALLSDPETGTLALWADHTVSMGELQPTATQTDALAERFAADRSGMLDDQNGAPLFARVYNPHLRMLIVGAVHIAQALAEMAARTGYDVTVIDPRDTWSTPERFPGIKLDRRWPSTALEDLAPDSRTAIVTLSHDPKLDDPALLAAFASPAFYIGSLGSKKTHAARLHRLRNADVAEDQIARIHAPVGLDIGAQNPAEIALSALAQITQALRKSG
ncbi:MAG: XdhC family protein [Rhodospirillaceae bacterium]|nr:XdhC family protein [Rhodospirillaceae bacterium]